MKRASFCIIVMLSLGLFPFPGPYIAGAFISDGFMEGVGLAGGKFDVYGKLGYQRMSVNINLPVSLSEWGAEFEDIDVKMAKRDFAIGSLGVSGIFGQRFGLFAEALVSAENSGTLQTYTSYSYWGGPQGPQGLSWDTQGVRYWEGNLGGSVSISNSAALLVGYKFDRLTQKLSRQSELYEPEIYGPDWHHYIGDLDIQTWSPYFGLRFDDRALRFDLTWSPWLTSYRAEMPLTWTNDLDDGEEYWLYEWQQNRYSLDGREGNLLEAYGEAKFNFVDVLAAKLWGKASWLNCSGNGDRELTSTDQFAPAIIESQSATGSLTRYLWAVGVAGNIAL